MFHLQKKELFLLIPTVNLFGAEICVAEMQQAPKFLLCFGINIGCVIMIEVVLL
jgi:hypothetical protein